LITITAQSGAHKLSAETHFGEPALKHYLPRIFAICNLTPLWLGMVSAQAGTELQCTFEVNSETHHIVFRPATDPYTVAAVPVGNRFRVKAIVLAAPSGQADTPIESVNMYVYYNTRRQPMVMQHLQFLQPVPLRNPLPDALTGRVSLYSPLLGKELQYRCALAEVSP
jgi:hypothetical protein